MPFHLRLQVRPTSDPAIIDYLSISEAHAAYARALQGRSEEEHR
ncbi:MAG: hypothetical protein NXI12_04050 [Alphaproteobacteria bacterium]|nr:hypothetical protein [Alphaproteobacteria bacterium]